MKSYRSTWIALFVFAGLLGLLWGVNQFLPADIEAYEGVPPDGKWKKTAAEWRSLLTPEQYRITREGGTERACSGGYCDSKADGVYVCVGCGQALFDSHAKFDSGTGWPSYFQPVDREHVSLRTDRSLFMRRTEVVCSRCDAHLGHVFRDGPPPTGLRFCINSTALKHLGRKQ